MTQTRQRLADALDAATSLVLLGRIRRLTNLTAPEYAHTEVLQVTELAAAANTDTDSAVLAGLDALVTAIEIGSRDPQRRADHLRITQTALPQLAMSVAFAASGVLSLADEESLDVSDAETADPASVPLDKQAVALRPDAAVRVDTAITLASDEPPAGPTSADDSTGGIPDQAPDATAKDAGVVGVVSHQVAGLDGARPRREPATDLPTAGLDQVLAGLELTMPPQETDEPPSLVAGPTHVVDEPVDAVVAREGAGVEALYASLLHSRQYALAYWLLTATGEPAPVAAAHRLVAHAAAIQTSAGSNAAAFADVVRMLDADVLQQRPEVQILVYAASVRAGLLSPTAGAAGPLRDLTTSVARSGPAVEELTEALLGAIYNGVYLTPRSADAVAEAAEAEATHEQLARAARDMLQSGPSRTIRYQAATELWQTWMAPGDYLGAPLTVVAKGSRDSDDLAFVRGRIRELRSRPSLEGALDRDARRSTKRSRRIEARARDKILAWTGEVTELLAEWVAATEDLTQPAPGTWMADPITDLRARANAVREQALAQLLSRSHTRDVVRDAAVDAAVALLRDALTLLDGSATLSGPEMLASRLVGGVLALAPDLPLDATPAPLRDVTVEDVAAAMDALAAGDKGWTAAFQARVDRHDHVGAQIVIDMLRPVSPHLAQRLTAVRDKAIGASMERLDAAITELSTGLDSDRRFGRMTAEQWADLSARVRAYGAGVRGPRRDFDVMLDDIAGLDQERSKTVRGAVDATRADLAAHSIDDAARDRIIRRIDDGDLTTAHEYLETVRSGRDLPGPQDELDHLRRFYPTFPALFAGAPSAQRTSPLAELRRAMEDGRNPAEGKLADALRSAGIDLSQLGRVRNAPGRIGQWTVLAESKSLDARVGAVKSVLEQLGFFAEAAHTPVSPRARGQGRPAWMQFTGVRATAGKALIPAFGTAISPSGDTLRVLAVWRSPTAQELVELLRNEPPDHAVIVLYFGVLDGPARRDLANEFRSGRKLPATAVVDEAAFAYLVAQAEPGRHITMAITLPFTWATPFTPDVAGLVPREMFYGRTEERDRVVDMMGSCIVYGGRQLGKSALLRAAVRDFDDGGVRHAIYQSIYKVGQATPVDAVWTTLWPRLAEKAIVPRDIPSGDIAVALTRHVTEWISGQSGRQLLVLLDESDSFLDADATDSRFTHVTHFKNLMESTERTVKVVFAGLHQTARFERLANHPLAHFGDPVCVGPLAPQPAYDLLTKPLQALGFRFQDHDHASRVLALANNQPALIQLFGAQLLRNLQRTPAPGAPPQVVTGGDIDAVWADGSLRTSFRKRFDWTLNLDPRYKVIAYSVAFHAHAHGAGSALTSAELRGECEQWWPKGFAAEDVRTAEFRALLDECVDLGVLSYAHGRYRLRTPNVLDLLGSREEIDEFLEQAESTPLPESFDGSLMRPQFGNSVTRGPLTSQQIADLLAPRRQVRLIAGSAALTVERCAKALQDENDKAASGRRGSYLREATPSTLRTACQQATIRAAGGHAVVLVNLRSSTLDVADGAWRTARDLIATHSGGTLGIVLITSPAQGPLWLTALQQSDMSSGVTGLRRYDRTDLRLWLTDTTLPFQDDASRTELLAVTGGWPWNVNKVAEELAVDQDTDSRVDPLGKLRSALADPAQADALVTASGARADDALHEAWRFLVSEFRDDRADPDTIADYLAMHADSGEPGADRLGEHQLKGCGYRDTAGVVEVLRTLGLLVPHAADGQLQVEPVIAAATRTTQG
ncbi:hypothetical protein [Plantactinospora veratri]